jgi:hypothetical protein
MKFSRRVTSIISAAALALMLPLVPSAQAYNEVGTTELQAMLSTTPGDYAGPYKSTGYFIGVVVVDADGQPVNGTGPEYFIDVKFEALTQDGADGGFEWLSPSVQEPGNLGTIGRDGRTTHYLRSVRNLNQVRIEASLRVRECISDDCEANPQYREYDLSADPTTVDFALAPPVISQEPSEEFIEGGVNGQAKAVIIYLPEGSDPAKATVQVDLSECLVLTSWPDKTSCTWRWPEAGAGIPAGVKSGEFSVVALNEFGDLSEPEYGTLNVAAAGFDPQGNLNNIETRSGGIWVRGWAADMDAPLEQLAVYVSIGGELGVGDTFGIEANLWRSDIPRTYPEFGTDHGFNATLPTDLRGEQKVYVYAENAPGTGGAQYKLLAIRTVLIGTDPHGNLNNIEARPGGIWVRGWAADWDVPTEKVRVKVSIGGELGAGETHTLDAGLWRQDIPRTYPELGTDHGFNQTLTTSKRGAQPVYVYAVNAPGTGGADKLIAVRTVVIS